LGVNVGSIQTIAYIFKACCFIGIKPPKAAPLQTFFGGQVQRIVAVRVGQLDVVGMLVSTLENFFYSSPPLIS
jgi:hypothetical protein